MENLKRFNTVQDYNEFNNNETLHPLISIVDFSKASPRSASDMYFGFYTVILKQVKCGDLKYGRQTYDYQEGTLIFISPGQVIRGDATAEVYQPLGISLIFHPDYLVGTMLGRQIHGYSFFSYQFHEALHLSDREKKIVLDCFAKIQHELEHPIDKHSKKIIITNMELLLNYCTRFYDRQFITRDTVHHGLLEKFEQLLNDYFLLEKPRKFGLPSVQYFAEELHLSANYFGDLVKKETGKTAKEYIQSKLIETAKLRLVNPDKSVSEVAYELGFKYPQHFFRFFKQQVNSTPGEFRNHHLQ
jgi:AraC family transcriptional activator of pobA